MNRAYYNVSGLQNVQDKTHIKNALDKLDGVQMVNVDLGRGSIEVGYQQPTEESEIERCIEHVGCKIQ